MHSFIHGGRAILGKSCKAKSLSVLYHTEDNIRLWTVLMQSPLQRLEKFLIENSTVSVSSEDFRLRLKDRIDAVSRFVNCEINLNLDKYSKRIKAIWGDLDVCSAFMAF